MVGLLPSYLCSYVTWKTVGSYSLCSQDLFWLLVPNVHTELGKTAFMYSALSSWNVLQKDLNPVELVSLGVFGSLLNQVVISLSGCRCFN